jgi:hypothetical protein
VTYKIGFDGVVTAELQKLLQSVQNRVNGIGIYAQTSDTGGASLIASGSTPPPCSNGQPCPSGEKGGQDFVVVVVTAIVAGAAAGYAAGKLAAKRQQQDGEKGGQD